MNTGDFIRLGIPLGEATRRATDFVSKFVLAGGDKTRLVEEVKAIIANPSAFLEDSMRGEFAKALLNPPPPPRTEPIKYRQWGEGLEHEAVMQMEKACLLPVAVAGALMPDGGHTALWLARHRWKVTAGDIAPRMLENAQRLCAEAGFRIETRLFPAEEMPFADGSFNYVFTSTSTMYWRLRGL